MSFISNYLSEYKECKRDFYQEYYSKGIYKEDKRYKEGVRRIGTSSGYKNKKKEDVSYSDIFWRISSHYSFAEGLAQLNFGWIRSFTTVWFPTTFIEKLLWCLLLPFLQLWVIVLFIQNYWQSKATVLNKLLFTLYALFVALFTLAIYAGVVYGIILLVRQF